MALPVSPFARRVLPLVDMTNVEDDCTDDIAHALCVKACGLPVPVAAVCLRPAFVKLAKEVLAGSGMKVATVVNFPDAQITPEMTGSNLDIVRHVGLAGQAVADGADEIDLVFAWKRFVEGDYHGPVQVVEAVKAACGPTKLKVILESGAYPDLAVLRQACDAVIDAGADFLKTSTTRISPAATPEAARVLCEASRAVGRVVGVKISGGVRTPEQAQAYLDIAADVMGLNWITPEHFRIGASKLVDNLLASASSTESATEQAVGY